MTPLLRLNRLLRQQLNPDERSVLRVMDLTGRSSWRSRGGELRRRRRSKRGVAERRASWRWMALQLLRGRALSSAPQERRAGASHEHRMRAQAAETALRCVGLQERHTAVHQVVSTQCGRRGYRAAWDTVPHGIPCRMGYRACGHGAVARPCRRGYALGAGRYLTWLKSHLVLSHPVVMFIFCKGDSHSAHGDEVPSHT